MKLPNKSPEELYLPHDLTATWRNECAVILDRCNDRELRPINASRLHALPKVALVLPKAKKPSRGRPKLLNRLKSPVELSVIKKRKRKYKKGEGRAKKAS